MRNLVYLIVLFICFGACKERYEVALPDEQTGILVVEGFINILGITEIKLSRSTIVGERNMEFEKNAVVRIEAEDNTIYPLDEKDSGKYVSAHLQLDMNRKYRLNIRTDENKQYTSTYEAPVITPPIDSISWIRYNGGVEIYVNAHDNINNTKYYRWEYDETWEFKSRFQTQMDVEYSTGPLGNRIAKLVYRDPLGKHADTLYRCWKDRSSSTIKLGSTEKLGEARVYSPIIFYPKASWELAVLYSVLVKQYGLNKDAYEFYSRIKKNTESLGSIFDAQPSEIKGNLVNIADEKELVVGYVGVGSVTEKRIFISNAELQDWFYLQPCDPEIEIPNISDSLIKYILHQSRIATSPINDRNGNLIGTSAAFEVCVDCRLRGTNIKPSFWP